MRLTNPTTFLSICLLALPPAAANAQQISDLPSGLISWWRAEGNCADETGAHPGSAEGSLTYTNGERGQCFVLDGSGGSVWLGTWFNLQQFTLSLWVNPAEGQQGYADLLDNNHSTSVSWPIQFQNFNENGISRWQWGPNGGVGGLINFNLQNDRWQHLVIARNGTNGTALYLNGTLAGTSTGSYNAIPYDGSQVLRLGRHESFGRYFHGLVDELMIFDRTLTATEAAAVYNATRAVPTWTTNSLPASCVAWWPAETNAWDVIGTNNGTLSGDTGFVAGYAGNGFVFDGTNDSVTVPHAEALNVPATGFTVEFWMKASKDQPEAISSIVDKDHSATDDTGWEVSCWRDTGRLSFGIGDGSSFPLCTNLTDVLDNRFHHVAFAWDRTNWLIYVDGVLENSLYRPTVANNTRPLRFGYHWGGDGASIPHRFYRGVLDEVRIYHRALSANEIAYLYSAIPRLDIAPAGNQIILSWQAPEDGWGLESTNALPSAAVASWPTVPPPYQTDGGKFSVTLTNNSATGSRFFRLHKP